MTLLDDAFDLLNLGNKLEETPPSPPETPGQRRMEAASKYFEACYLMKRHINWMPIDPSSDSDASKMKRLLQEKIEHYEQHAKNLLQGQGNGKEHPLQSGNDIMAVGNDWQHLWDQAEKIASNAHVQSSKADEMPVEGGLRSQTTIALENALTEKAGRANARLTSALDLDEAGQKKEALSEYMKAAELYLAAVKLAEEAEIQCSVGPSISSIVKRKLEGVLDRIEQLKQSAKKTCSVTRPLISPQQPEQHEISASLTPSEIAVLKRSSLISSGLFMPWSDDEAENFDYHLKSNTTWTDPDGLLKLSDKQNARFHKWARPAEILSMRRSTSKQPVMVKTITPYTIRQKYVTDCSFIASLCICASFERRFNRRLVTSIIYPQDENGYPVYNKSGVYLVRLWLNGVARRVIVDDLLPVDKQGNLICSHTDAPGLELWVSIIEKAYMKLCGGYDFPGSNSGVDLFSLTGWIPERIFFPEDAEKIRDFETPSERAWERLYGANSYGDCLITVSTSSDISDQDADSVGLVTGHAYAVLSAIKTGNGTRLLQLKNPWAHQGWKGKFSCHDHESWSDPDFCAEVGYNPKIASQHDDGVFWIRWEDALVYFRNLHLSWNPALFSYRMTVHGDWPSDQGPADDSFNIGENPQYLLTLSEKALNSNATVWILLSRHVTKQEQEGSEASDFLTLHIHRNNSKKQRIWYPGGKTCVLTGAYTNNPHVLVRYDVRPEDKFLSLVLSQYQKSNDLGYTISCFCTKSFKIGYPAKEHRHMINIPSEWTDSSAGGPPGQKHFGSNPMFSVTIPNGGSYIRLMCRTMKTFAINLMLIHVDCEGERVDQIWKEPVIDTGDYRHGFVASDAVWLSGGHYTAIVSTFRPGQVGAFVLSLNSSATLQVNSI